MKVLTFGTFSKFHKGHEYHLNEASKYGDLYVVLARDKTVKEVKGKPPEENELIRLKKVNNLKFVKKALLGSKGDKYEVLTDTKPDIICLGYDQTHFTEKLEEELKKRNIKSEIIRIKAYKPEKYKTSLL
ncbi:MAG: adenylyltransferase/cytidyltransferase family protein [Candidatus Woesearchaeota archaeon]